MDDKMKSKFETLEALLANESMGLDLLEDIKFELLDKTEELDNIKSDYSSMSEYLMDRDLAELNRQYRRDCM